MTLIAATLSQRAWQGIDGSLDGVGIVAAQNGDDDVAFGCLAIRQLGAEVVDPNAATARVELTLTQWRLVVDALERSLATSRLLGDIESTFLLEAALAEVSEALD